MDIMPDEKTIQYATAFVMRQLQSWTILNEWDKEDIVQNCLCKICRNWNRFDPAKMKPESYACLIAISGMRDQLKKHTNLYTTENVYEDYDLMSNNVATRGDDIDICMRHVFGDDGIDYEVAKAIYDGDRITDVYKRFRVTTHRKQNEIRRRMFAALKDVDVKDVVWCKEHQRWMVKKYNNGEGTENSPEIASDEESSDICDI